MKKGKNKIRLIKEDEKIRQVTHWDLDYLPKDEILDLYRRETGHHNQKTSIELADEKSYAKVSMLLITLGLLLLAGALCVAALY